MELLKLHETIGLFTLKLTKPLGRFLLNHLKTLGDFIGTASKPWAISIEALWAFSIKAP